MADSDEPETVAIIGPGNMGSACAEASLANNRNVIVKNRCFQERSLRWPVVRPGDNRCSAIFYFHYIKIAIGSGRRTLTPEQ